MVGKSSYSLAVCYVGGMLCSIIKKDDASLAQQFAWWSAGKSEIDESDNRAHVMQCFVSYFTRQLNIQTKFSISSPQQIVDCSYTDGNMGCEGGSLRAAFRYVTREGLTSELHYPYIGKVGRVVYDICYSLSKW